jgi:hypothetical protein
LLLVASEIQFSSPTVGEDEKAFVGRQKARRGHQNLVITNWAGRNFLALSVESAE